MNWKSIIVILTLLATAGYFFLNGQGQVTPEQKERIKDVASDVFTAPDFTLQDLDGNLVSLSDLRGKLVLVNFWATWCYPCRMEIPEFNDLYKQYKDRGLEILGVSMSDTQKALQNFTKSFKVDYPILYGTQQDLNKISMMYGGISAVPTTFIVNAQGELVKIFPGAIIKGQPIYYEFIRVIESELKEK